MTRVGDYELDRQIGAGAAGTVWKAHRRGPVTRVVALKRLRAGSGAVDLARIRREATLLTELDHPHVVRVLEVIQDGDGVALAMQFAPGGSLDDLLAERGRLAPGQVVAVAAPVADALASAHRRGVLHGDVKPANVLFTSDGEPLLTDFGVARTLGRVTTDQPGGTAEYLAPELLDGAVPDPGADVYSLAVVCYLALAGAVPYTGTSPLAVVRAADAGVHRPLHDVPGVPGALAAVVERGLARAPHQRFPSADEFARALRGAVPPAEVVLPGPAANPRAPVGDGPTDGTRTWGPRPPRPEQPDDRRRWRAPAAVVAVGVVAAGLLWLVRGPLAGGDDPGGGRVPPAGDCAGAERPEAGEGSQVVAGDVTGDGCTTYGIYQYQPVSASESRMVLTIRVDGDRKQIALGEPGDQVVLGDWDCDGVDTPGVYRAAAGAVNYFDVWPRVADQQYGPDLTEPAIVGGKASLDDGAHGGCDRILVTTTGTQGLVGRPRAGG
ncbi:MAG TPA: serine/threonine-protein kinase [Acidimicrobiales bacterium]|nr:serine/threonine-protein kinase [Acidimicrobiales bacterium]